MGRPRRKVNALEMQQVCILFADFAGFSKLSEAELGVFINRVMPHVASTLNKKNGAFITNTWGDGIFAVFKTADVAAQRALELRDAVANKDWTSEGIQRNDFGLRIALHNAPVLIYRDPITKKLNAYGNHINRAARLEPITILNKVFATEEFISALTSYGKNLLTIYSWEPLGKLNLAKDFGASNVFHLHRVAEKSIDIGKVHGLQTKADTLEMLMPRSRAFLPNINMGSSDTAQILKHIDENIMGRGIVRHNWNISISYDMSQVAEGTILEHLSWDYELVSHNTDPVVYPVALWAVADMETGGGLRSLHKLLPDGRLETIISPDVESTNEGGLIKRQSSITLDPHIRYKLELEYHQSWSVNPKAPKIHNNFSPTNTAMNVRMKVDVPSGTKVDVLMDGAVTSSVSDAGKQRIYSFNIPSPVLKNQAIEYHIVFPKLN